MASLKNIFVTPTVPKGACGFAWKRWFGLQQGYAVNDFQVAKDATALRIEVEPLITLNVIHELSHLFSWDPNIHSNGEEFEQKVSIVTWNYRISMAIGCKRMALSFLTQLMCLKYSRASDFEDVMKDHCFKHYKKHLTIMESLDERMAKMKTTQTFTYPDILLGKIK
jgi:hypothetical protein